MPERFLICIGTLTTKRICPKSKRSKWKSNSKHNHWFFSRYPKDLSTDINEKHPIRIFNQLDGWIYKVFLGSSPRTLCADGRTDDLTAILSVIKNAEKYIYIAVNEYIPMDLWKKRQPWPVIDDQLREGMNLFV